MAKKEIEKKIAAKIDMTQKQKADYDRFINLMASLIKKYSGKIIDKDKGG